MPSLLLVLRSVSSTAEYFCRSVPAEHRSVSLGFKGFVISLFGEFLCIYKMCPCSKFCSQNYKCASLFLDLEGVTDNLIEPTEILLATLPSPVLWGAIIDGTCLLWSSSCEGKTGDCQIYDADTLRLKFVLFENSRSLFRIHLVFAAFRFISLFTDVYVW